MSVPRCKRCHRRLKNSECINVGYGKSCYKKVFGTSFPKKQKNKSLININLSSKSSKSEVPPLITDFDKYVVLEEENYGIQLTLDC